ncbi:MAG: hypothetical protein FWC04_09635, partial [Chitinispirillia bacterium]|nr:hypothetical protein [Chitinispirillia bacterium]
MKVNYETGADDAGGDGYQTEYYGKMFCRLLIKSKDYGIMFCRCLEPMPSHDTWEKRRLAVPAGACNPCIHISAAESLAPIRELAARHERR